MKRTVLAGGLVILVVSTLAMAQMMPPDGGAVPGVLPSAAAPAPATQSANTDPIEAADAEFAELLEMQAGMGEAERQTEEDYLKLDLGPDVDVSSIEQVPSAAENQPNRTCEPTAEMDANLRRHGSKGDRAYRDIAGYLSVTNVIAAKDCTCAGKIIPHETVALFEERLREKLGVTVLEPKHTRDLYKEYDRQIKIVDAMCGEY